MSENWGAVKYGQEEETEDQETQSDKVEVMIEKIMIEFRKAHSRKYEPEDAEKTAALCLEAQKELTEFLSDAELISKEKKLEVERIEAEKIFYYKSLKNGGEKVTDTILKAYVAKDDDVCNAKKGQYKAEADFNKWKNLLNVLKDGHLFFRGVSKGKNEW